MMLGFLFCCSLIPLILYLVDGYYQKNVKKGVYYILTFLGLALLAGVLAFLFGFYFVLTIPLVLAIFILVTQKNGTINTTTKED
jgi:uncharacterized protein YqhQ